MTRKRLKIAQVLIWVVSLAYNVPYLVLYDTMSFGEFELCYHDEENTLKLKWLSLVNMLVWFCLPLVVIAVLYYRVAKTLWATTVVSAMRLRPYPDMDHSTSIRLPSTLSSSDAYESNVDVEISMTKSTDDTRQNKSKYRLTYASSTTTVAKARKKVIRLLICVVVAFAICVFPHMVKVLDHYWNIFTISHKTMLILSPVSFIILYMNSVLNPFLYAIFSTNFRRSFADSVSRCRKYF